MLIRKYAFIFGLLLILCAPNAEVNAAENLDLDTVSGVYKDRFKNGDVAGNKFQSENILEIVKLSPDTTYFRTHLEFFNGHICGLWGVAERKDNALIYKSTAHSSCEFKITFGKDKIALGDENGQCRQDTCGTRGGYDHITFDRDTGHAIRYMSTLRNSPQFKDALKEYDASHPKN